MPTLIPSLPPSTLADNLRATEHGPRSDGPAPVAFNDELRRARESATAPRSQPEEPAPRKVAESPDQADPEVTPPNDPTPDAPDDAAIPSVDTDVAPVVSAPPVETPQVPQPTPEAAAPVIETPVAVAAPAPVATSAIIAPVAQEADVPAQELPTPIATPVEPGIKESTLPNPARLAPHAIAQAPITTNEAPVDVETPTVPLRHDPTEPAGPRLPESAAVVTPVVDAPQPVDAAVAPIVTATPVGSAPVVEAPAALGADAAVVSPTVSQQQGDSETRQDGDQRQEQRPATPAPVDARGPALEPALARAAEIDAALRAERVTGAPVEVARPAAAPVVAAPTERAAPGAPTLAPQVFDTDDAAAPTTRAVVRGMQAMVNQRGGVMTMRLTPPELGALRIEMSVVRGVVTAQFQPALPQAHALLEQNMSSLRTALEQHGLTVERISVQAPASSGGAQAGGSETSDQGRGHGHDAASGQSRGRGESQQQQHDDGAQASQEFLDQLMELGVPATAAGRSEA